MPVKGDSRAQGLLLSSSREEDETQQPKARRVPKANTRAGSRRALNLGACGCDASKHALHALDLEQHRLG